MSNRQEMIDVYAAMLAAIDRWSEVSGVVAAARGDDNAMVAVIDLLGTTEAGAEAVLSMPMRRLANRARIQEELDYVTNGSES
jgi:DNA gyrase/topoisomerase IV subunit A